MITDGLPAQRYALMELVNESDDCNVQAIIPVYCLAHLTQLAFLDTLRRCKVMENLVAQVSELVLILRRPIVCAELGEKCPSICQTRWLYIVDVLLWLFQRQDKINAFLMASENNETTHDHLPEEWKRLLFVLSPLKQLNLYMEASSCALWEVIPLVEKTMAVWKARLPLLMEHDTEILKELVTNLLLRLEHVSPSVVAAAFSLSELGRLVLRQKEKGLQTRGEEHVPYVSRRIASLDNYLAEGGTDIRLLGSNDTAPSTDVRTLFDDVPSDHRSSPDEESSDSIDDEEHGDTEGLTRNRFTSTTIQELLEVPVFEYSFANSFEEIKRVGQLLGLDARYMYSCFRTWLYEDRTKTPTGHEIGQSPDMIWRRTPSIDDRWRDFAKLCLRFVTIGTSEADCERSLSRQRQVQGLNTTNITTELLEARMRT